MKIKKQKKGWGIDGVSGVMPTKEFTKKRQKQIQEIRKRREQNKNKKSI